MMKKIPMLIVEVACISVLQAQSVRKLHEQYTLELDQEKSTYDSISRLWQTAKNDLWNRRKTTNYQFSPEFNKRIEKCLNETGKIHERLAILKKLNVSVVDSLEQINRKLNETSERKLYAQVHYGQALNNNELEFSTVQELFGLEKKKKSEQNVLMSKQLGSYESAKKKNLDGLQTMSNWMDSLVVAKKQLQDLNSELYMFHIRLADYRLQLDQQLSVLRKDYTVKKGKGFPAAYQDVFGVYREEEPMIRDSEPIYGVEEMSKGDAFGPPEPRVETAIEPAQPLIHDIVDEQAEFPGGFKAMKEYIAKNLKYPEVAIEMGYSGNAFVKFVVSDQGEISNVKVIKGIADCPECDREAVVLVKGMPKWKPAMNGGKAVNSYYNLPVTFKVQ